MLVGHSIGAIMAAQLAADAAGQRLPQPRAVFALQPPHEDEVGLRPLRRIPPSTLLLVLASDQDDRVGEAGAEALWGAIAQLPAANRDYVRVRSDQRGPVALRADHHFPLRSADNPPDALDSFGPWKLLDGLQRCATVRQDREFAMRGTVRQRFMGTWSDGGPVLPLRPARRRRRRSTRSLAPDGAAAARPPATRTAHSEWRPWMRNTCTRTDG